LFLYHGTYLVIETINLSKCKNRTDFGKGFYLTDKIGTAQIWALDTELAWPKKNGLTLYKR
jgi:hypothetical protein